MPESHSKAELDSSTYQEPIRVLLVDDHSVVRKGTREILSRNTEFLVVGEAESGEGLEGLLRLKQPDLLLLDINLPGDNGLQLLAKLQPKFPNIKIVLFSAYIDLPYLRKAKELGAAGFLNKTTEEIELRQLLKQIFQAKPEDLPFFSPDLKVKLKEIEQSKGNGCPLTQREREILEHLAEGHSNQAIADLLCVSVKTVDTHVSNLLKKAQVRSRTQLISHASKLGWLSP